MARARRTRSGHSVRRPVEWLRLRIANTTIPSAAGLAVGAAFDLTPTQLLLVVSPTIVRIRGRLTLSADFTGVPHLRWAAGIVQMSRKAFTAGLGSIPFPMIDDADWQWFDAGAVGDAAAGVSPAEDVVSHVIDTKAMRRYEQDDQTCVLVITNDSLLAAGEDLFVDCALSILIKE